jgi:hypothetical protein
VVGSIYGIAHKVRSGRTVLTGQELLYTTPLAYLGVRIFGGKKARGYKAVRQQRKQKLVPLRWGAGLVTRFATGDSHLPFGPFLILGAFVCTFWPTAIHDGLMSYSEWVGGLFRPR